MLRIPARIYAEMVAHAFAGLPNEACGLLAGPAAIGAAAGTSMALSGFVPMANAAQSAVIYRFDPVEQMQAERSVDEAGAAVVGVMHSHTRSTAYPSPTDVEDASRFDPLGSWRFVIVSLSDAEPALRCYRIRDSEIIEESVEILA